MSATAAATRRDEASLLVADGEDDEVVHADFGQVTLI